MLGETSISQTMVSTCVDRQAEHSQPTLRTLPDPVTNTLFPSKSKDDTTTDVDMMMMMMNQRCVPTTVTASSSRGRRSRTLMVIAKYQQTNCREEDASRQTDSRQKTLSLSHSLSQMML